MVAPDLKWYGFKDETYTPIITLSQQICLLSWSTYYYLKVLVFF